MTYDQFYAIIMLLLFYIGWAAINCIVYLVVLILKQFEFFEILVVNGLLIILRWSWRLHTLTGMIFASTIVWFLITTAEY